LGNKEEEEKCNHMHLKNHDGCFNLYVCVQYDHYCPCVCVQLVQPPTKKSSRLLALHEGPSSPLLHEPDPFLLPNSPTLLPSNTVSAPSIASFQCREANYVHEEILFDGRESSLEGDSSDDAEEIMEDAFIEEALGWSPRIIDHG
jgi:hypothetical protein